MKLTNLSDNTHREIATLNEPNSSSDRPIDESSDQPKLRPFQAIQRRLAARPQHSKILLLSAHILYLGF